MTSEGGFRQENERKDVHWKELSGIREPEIHDLLSGKHKDRVLYNETPEMASRFLTWMSDRMVCFGECQRISNSSKNIRMALSPITMPYLRKYSLLFLCE